MEPVSALARVTGLVVSLDTILRTLQYLTSNYASRTLDHSCAHTEDSFQSLYRNSTKIQSSLHTDPKGAQVEELLQMLHDIEKDLEDLHGLIQNEDRWRRLRLIRRFLWDRDKEDAVTSILLAKNVIHIIRTLQGLGHRDNMLIEHARSHNQTSLQYLTQALKPRHHWPLSKTPNTKAQDMFSRIVGLKGQEKLHEQYRADRLAGTCEWFLDKEEYQSWLQRPSQTGDHAIFWCQGKPGIGKTILASKVIDQLQPLHVVAYFYMSNVKLQSASDVVTSLLRQLCLPFHIVPARLQQMFEQTNSGHGCRLQLKDALGALQEASRSIHQPIIIIIDGLDETNIPEQSDFVQVFDSLKDTSTKCLVTSRGTQYVLPKAYNSSSEFVIDDQANRRDIHNFVECVLEENKPVKRMLNDDPKLREEVLDTLTSRAHGMFHWATLQVRLILDQTHLSGIRNALNTIPSDIREIVDSALRMIKLQDKNRAELANRALALLTAAQVPLTAEAMCHALGLAHILDYEKRLSELHLEEIPNPESIIECCMGLIKMDPMTSVVTLAHYDILQEMRGNRVEFFSSDYTARLAKTCIAYLSLAAFSDGPCHAENTFRKHLEEHPFLEYASHHWGYHARATLLLGAYEAEVIDDIRSFLKLPTNLGLSLQVCKYVPEAKQQTLDIFTDPFLRVSELHVASRHGLAVIVRDLLKTSPDMILSLDWYNRTPLHEAAQAGWEDIVKILINAGADPSLKDGEGKTPFVYAAECGHAKVISVLQHQPESGQHQLALEEALYDAADAGKTSVVEELLRLRVNPDAAKSKISAMTAAALRRHKHVVRLLLDNEASVSYEDGLPSDSLPLHQAIRNGHVEIAALLLDFGANVQARDNLGRTALFETLVATDIRGAALLLRNGIDISCHDHNGDTVLHEAAKRGNLEHASRFVDQGVGIDITNREGLTPLHLAARYGHPEVATLLLQKGASINDRDINEWTPLMHAVSAGNTQLSKALLDYGASVDGRKVVEAVSKISPEETSHHQFQRPPVDYMLDQGAEIDDGNDISKTPLTCATETSAISNSSIEHGAMINHPNSALVLAAQAGHCDILKLLLDHGTKSGLTDEELTVAMTEADKAGHHNAVRLLSRARKGFAEQRQ